MITDENSSINLSARVVNREINELDQNSNLMNAPDETREMSRGEERGARKMKRVNMSRKNTENTNRKSVTKMQCETVALVMVSNTFGSMPRKRSRVICSNVTNVICHVPLYKAGECNGNERKTHYHGECHLYRNETMIRLLSDGFVPYMSQGCPKAEPKSLE